METRLTRLMLLVVMIVLMVRVAPTTQAQSPTYETVTITAEDGLELYGVYGGVEALTLEEDELAPAVLLMHHSGASKEKWLTFMPQLTAANYAVLSIDLRGHGESTERGADAPTPELWYSDTHQWLEWLRQQPGIDPARISIVGASLGGDIGLNVMVQDEELKTIVVISVGLEVLGVTTEPAVTELDRPIYLVTSLNEIEPVQTLTQLAHGDFQVRVYDGSICCTFLVDFEDSLAPTIIAWLDQYSR